MGFSVRGENSGNAESLIPLILQGKIYTIKLTIRFLHKWLMFNIFFKKLLLWISVFGIIMKYNKKNKTVICQFLKSGKVFVFIIPTCF